MSAFLSAGLVSKKMPLVGDSNLRIFADEVTSKGSTVYVNCRLDVLSSIDFKDLSNTVTDMLTDYLSQYTDNNHSLGFLRDATNKQTTITNLVVDGI